MGLLREQGLVNEFLKAIGLIVKRQRRIDQALTDNRICPFG